MSPYNGSYIGLVGNERADQLARQASSDGVPLTIHPFYTDCLRYVREHCSLNWKEHFDQRSVEKGVWYKTIQSEPCPSPWFDSCTFARSEIVTALRLRSGHISLNKFACLMKNAPSPNCTECGKVEDVLYILAECARNEDLRTELLLHSDVDVKQMSLPQHFSNPEEYFEECLKFFQEYQYLINYPNTELLIHDILDKIAIENEEIDVFNQNFDLSAICNDFLNSFFTKLRKLQVFYNDIEEDSIDCNINVPVSPKKKHEIFYLSKEIQNVCENVGCEVVVDFGSGLGYLDQLLFEKTNYKLLGIECNESHYVGAKIRQRKYHADSIENVKYVKHTITQNSHENIEGLLQDKFENHREFCITGLHACADLTIDAINIFLNMKDAKAMIIMPCCYHKMEGNDGMFKNFPLSDSLKSSFDRFKAGEFMRVPFLRLAAQPPSVDDKLEDLVFNLLSRAVLQLFAFQHNFKLKRNKRKAVKTKNMDNNFEIYIKDATANGFTLVKDESSLTNDKVQISKFYIEELMTLWNQISQLSFKKAGIFILLQNYLQPVIENFVLYDRLVYLKEKGVNDCEFKKILNVKKSPRCLALVANK